MKKNGFTLVELLVSITLVSIVLIVMLNSLVKLKAVYDRVDDETDIRVTGAIIAREIGYDIMSNKGIESYTPVASKKDLTIGSKKVNTSTLDFVLNENGAKRRLIVTSVTTTTSGTNSFDAKTKGLEYNKDTTASTVNYYDITDENNHKPLLIKTVTSEETYTINKLSGRKESSDIMYYHFTGITINESKYNSNNYSNKFDYLYTICLTASAKEYDVKIYSAKTGT